MMSDEQAAAQKAALEREKAGYANRLAVAEENDDSEKVGRFRGLIKGVEKALEGLDSLSDGTSPSMSNTKAVLLAAAEAGGVEVDESMTKAEILEALEAE